MNKTDVLGVSFVNASMFEAVEQGIRAMAGHEGKYAVAPDSEMLLAARKSKKLMNAIKGAELVLPAGSGIIYASRILGIPIEKKISAYDYASALMARMGEKNMSVLILTGDEETLKPAIERVARRYPGIRISGCLYGEDPQAITEAVDQAEPDLLLVGLDTPAQELWMRKNAGKRQVGLMLGFGKELNILAGKMAPVPQKWRDSGFEWLYKLIREPWLILRMLKRTGLIFAALQRRLLG